MWTSELVKLGACADAVAWARTQPDRQTAWANCHRADWMLWFCARYAGPPWSEGRRRLVLCAADCAETALRRIRDERVERIALSAIQTARAWARGEATADDLLGTGTSVAAAAAAAAYAAATDAAAYAAYDAAAYDVYATAAVVHSATAALRSAAYDVVADAATNAANAAAYAAAADAVRSDAYDAADAYAYAYAYAAANARSAALRTMAGIVRQWYPIVRQQE